ncbi:MAG: hypothetical protein AB7S36_23500, partial [Planctomycetota bacterium]
MATPNAQNTGDQPDTSRRPLNLAPNARVKAQTSRRKQPGSLPVAVAGQTIATEDIEVARDTGMANGTVDSPDSPDSPAAQGSPDDDTATVAHEYDAREDLPNYAEPTINFDPNAVAVTHTIDGHAGVTLAQTGRVQPTADAQTLVTSRGNSTGSGSSTNGGASAGTSTSASGRLMAAGSASDRRYEVQRELARGGMGAIMIARDHDLRRDVAMKVLLGATRNDSSDKRARGRIARFLDEAQITGQLEHPNIVPVHEIGADTTGRLYFTMKLVDGEALSEIIGKLRHQAAGQAQIGRA